VNNLHKSGAIATVATVKDDIMRRIIILTISILVTVLLSTACSSIDVSSTAPTPYTYEYDPLFRVFIIQNGGADRFGPAISTLFRNHAGERLQFLERGLLVYDPVENEIYFSPLGIALELMELPNNTPAPPGSLVINGFQVHPALVDFYLDLGRELVGAPISNPYYNYAKNRLEQHFENLGLYYLLDDPNQTPHLLSYGLVACSTPGCEAYESKCESCQIIEPVSDETFQKFIDDHGIPTSLHGDLVEGPILCRDNTTEMVLEHMVLSSRDGQISILPIPQLLGYSQTGLFTAIDSPMLTFIPIQDNLGHNVFNEFHEFISAHGGYEVSGNPTTELFAHNLETNAIRQCFTYLCLDYFPNVIEAKVRPVQLGREYLNRNIDRCPIEQDSDEPVTILSRKPPQSVFELSVWESYTTINSGTPQTISVLVSSKGVPQPGQNLELSISMPDNSEQRYNLPPTTENGRTGITILPIAGENGDLVEYQVCLAILGQEPICIRQSFLIWGNP
jgi:hypothetical protein